jgi:hypothetical protein
MVLVEVIVSEASSGKQHALSMGLTWNTILDY